MIHFAAMKRAAASLIFALSFVVSVARPAAALDPKMIETDWKWNTKFSSFTSATSQTIDVSGFGTVGYSSVSANVIARSYTVLAQGGSAQWRVVQTTRTFSAASNPSPYTSQVPLGWFGSTYAASLSTSGYIGAPAGVPYNGDFFTLVSNPVFYFDSLSTAATYWIWVEYGTPRNSR